MTFLCFQAKADCVYRDVIYRNESVSGRYLYAVIGTTLTADSPNGILDITQFVLTEYPPGIGYTPGEWHADARYEALKRLPPEVFANNDFITDINLNAPYTSGWFESKAFYNASALKTFRYCWNTGNTRVATPDSVFMQSSIRSISISSSSSNAFSVGKSFAEATPNLESVHLGVVAEIGENAFKGSAVRRVYISTLYSKTISDGAFEDSGFSSFSYDDYDYGWAHRLTITHFGKRCFKNSKITTIPFASAVAVDEEAFAGTPLRDVDWSAKLKTIGARAFAGTHVREAFLSPVIETIGEGAFAGCDNLTTVYISNPEPPAITWDDADPSRCTFPAGTTIYVPSYAVEVYKNCTDANGLKVWANYTILPLPSRHADGNWEWNGVTYSGLTKKVDNGQYYEVMGFTPSGASDGVMQLARGPLAYDEASGLTFYYDAYESNMNVWFPENLFKDSQDVKEIIDSKNADNHTTILFDKGSFEASAVETVKAGSISVKADAFKESRLKRMESLMWLCVYEDGLRDTPQLQTVKASNLSLRGADAFKNSGVTEVQATIWVDQSSGAASDTFYPGTFENSGLKKLSGSNDKTLQCDVTAIGERAFKNAPLEILNVTWPKLTVIEDEAFSGTLISDFAWGDPLVSIGREAFAGTRIEQLRLPASLRSIGEGAFAGCGQLTDVWALTIEPPAITWDDADPSRCTFPAGITVHTLPSYVKFYQADAAWKHYVIKGDGDTTAIGAIETDGNADAISVIDGRIVAEGYIEVYATDGRLIAAGVAAELPSLSAGLYIVRAGASTAKVVIR